MKRVLWLAFLLAFLFLALLLVILPAQAQTKQLIPVPRIQFLDTSGNPLANGHVHTYISLTTTNQATYTDSGGGTPNANPVLLDAGGFAGIWLTSDESYTIEVHNSSNVLQWSVDNVTTILTLTNTWATAQTFTGTITAGRINEIRYVDGTEYTTIQGALDGLPAGGGLVIVPPGTFTITSTITMPSNSTLMGTGAASIIKASASFGNNSLLENDTPNPATDGARNTNITVRNLKFDSSASNGDTSRPSMLFKAVVDLVIDGVWSADSVGDGILISASSTVTVKPLRNSIRNNTITNAGRNGIAVTEGERVIISDNQITGSALHGIDLEPNNASSVIREVTIEGNVINGSGSSSGNSGIAITGGGGTTEEVTANGNTIRSTAEGIVFSAVSGVSISTNVISSVSQNGIVNTTSNASTDVTISNNSITSPTLRGIQTGTNDLRISIIGNVIDTPGSTGITVGGDRCTIQGNTILSSTLQGILVSGGQSNSIVGNVIRSSTKSGIELILATTEPSFNTIVGNVSIDSSGDHGIEENSGASPVSNYIVGNILTGNSGGALLRQNGANSVYGPNIGDTAASFHPVAQARMNSLEGDLSNLPRWIFKQVDFGDMTAGATADTFTLWTLPANTMIHDVVGTVVTGWSGGSISAAVCSVGTNGGAANDLTLDDNFFAAATVYELHDATASGGKGALLFDSTDKFAPYMAVAAATIEIQCDLTGDNHVNATAGQARIYILVSQPLANTTTEAN